MDEDDDSERREARSSVQQSASDSVTHSPSSEQFLTEEEKQMAMVMLRFVSILPSICVHCRSVV